MFPNSIHLTAFDTPNAALISEDFPAPDYNINQMSAVVLPSSNFTSLPKHKHTKSNAITVVVSVDVIFSIGEANAYLGHIA